MPKFLIIRFSSLGDVVITTSVIRGINENYKDAKIFYLTKPQFKPLLSGLSIEKVWTIDMPFWKIISEIKNEEIDYLLDLHKNQRSMLYSFASGIKTKIGTDKRSVQRRMLVKANIKKYEKNSIVADHFKNLGIIGIDRQFDPKLILPSMARDFANQNDIGQDTIIIHPGAKWPLKRWGIDRYAELAAILKTSKEPVFIDDEHVELPWKNRFRTIKTDNLTELICALGSCGVFIGNDSGPGHIAAALGIPTVTIFGPTHPALGFAPQGGKTLIIQKNPGCSPCSLHGNDKCKLNGKKHGKCMIDLNVEYVAKLILRFIDDEK